MPTLSIPRQGRTILGSQVRPGMIIKNPKAASGLALLVCGGSEFSRYRLGRLFTDQEGRRSDVVGAYVQDGQGHMVAIPEDREYELVSEYHNIIAVPD